MTNMENIIVIDGEDYILVDGKIKPVVVFDDDSYVIVDDYELIDGELVQLYCSLGGVYIDF